LQIAPKANINKTINIMKKTLLLMSTLLALAACAPKSKAPALDMANLDPSTSPKEDFYQYSTGGWQKNNPLRPEFSRYGSFDALREQAQENLNALFESMTTSETVPGTVEQKITDLYKMALDSTTRNELGAQPIQKYIAEIQAVKSKDELATLLGKMSLYGEGGFFGAGVEADLTNSDMQILYLGQGGLGMGDRDYYLLESNKALKDGYQAFLVKALNLAGVADAEAVVAKDMAVEDAMAQIFWTREENRNMEKIYNPMSSEQIFKSWPALGFDKICSAAGIAPQEKIIVQQPSYFEGLNAFFGKTDLETLKAYLLTQFVSGQCSALSDDFYTASWEFFSHQMAGAQEQQPRWKRAMSVPNSILGEAVGEMYVSRYFPESSKQKMVTLVENLRTALGQHIDQLEWMGDETKAKAQEKLAAFTVKIGYPDKWKDYSSLDINPENTYYENLRNASAWYVKDNMDKLGKPTDKTEWGMTPQTVNAYYNPTTNEICFPAAILQKPFFDPEADEPVNYGGIGVVIGHEMSHGFDDQGSMFDAVGNMVNWWTDEDKAKFNALGDKLAAQFDEVEILPGVHANGRYTLGENIGDHGGLSIAFTAMENAVAGKKDPMIDGFTRAQRFYLSYGAIWAQNITDEEKARLTNMDVHSLAVNRVNVSVRNFQTFFDAFDIHEGDKMFRPEEERVHIW
jgi:putative endopeptidase